MLQLFTWLWLKKQYEYSKSEKYNTFSIVIPVRNESSNITTLLQYLECQDYPKSKFEVIIINDHSSDETVELIKEQQNQLSISIKLQDLEEGTASFKKRALIQGIRLAQFDYIITTDGDCKHQVKWLESFNEHLCRHNSRMVVGAVAYQNDQHFFTKCQQIELSALIGSGAASLGLGFPTMCNGANLCYEKKSFYEVGGFSGYETEVSGDDEFLMHKFYEAYRSQIHFCFYSNNVVHTNAHLNLDLFWNQRKRWASKWSRYSLLSTKFFAIYIFVIHLSQILLLLALPTKYISLSIFFSCLLLRIVSELLFLSRVSKFLKKKFHLLLYLIVIFPYSIYVVLFALTSRFGKYTWKGRKY